jgi:hypothetical protein
VRRVKFGTLERVIALKEVMSGWLNLDGDNAIKRLPHGAAITMEPRRTFAKSTVANLRESEPF